MTKEYILNKILKIPTQIQYDFSISNPNFQTLTLKIDVVACLRNKDYLDSLLKYKHFHGIESL